MYQNMYWFLEMKESMIVLLVSFVGVIYIWLHVIVFKIYSYSKRVDQVNVKL